jgi:hypothetical protein
VYYAIRIKPGPILKSGYIAPSGAITDVEHAELFDSLPDAYRAMRPALWVRPAAEARIVRLSPQQARPQLPWDDDRLESFAWPGGYTIAYYTRDGSTLCADCARRELPDVESADTYDEGPDVICEGCNATLESSYGELEDCHD